MFSNKIKITLTLGIILLLSVVSVAQAAPPLQGPSGTSQGHTLDLDPAGNNLGAVMKGSNAEDSAGDSDVQNHVAAALANYFGEMSYEEIMALHESGVGFGNIARGLYFTTNFDLEVGAADLVAEAGQSGWGKTLRDNGIHPGSLGKGRGHQPEHTGANANNGQGNGNGKGNNGHGNGNNVHGQGNNGHGKGKNKGGSDVADPDVDSDDDDGGAADTDVDSEDNEANDGASNNNGRGKGKGNNGQAQGKGNNGKSNGKSKGNGNNSQSHGNNSNNGNNGNNDNNDNNGQNSSDEN